MRRLSMCLCAVTALAGCGDVHDDRGQEDARLADSELIREGSPEALGVLGFLNARSTTGQLLDDEVGLYKRPAYGIAAHVRGSDQVWGTEDDDPIDSIAELDGISRVGQATMDRVLAYVESHGGLPSLIVEGVPMTVAQAAQVLNAANTASLLVLDDVVQLDSRAAQNIVAARPFASIDALAAVPYVGKSALRSLLAYAKDPPPDPDVNRQTYVVDGVEMTVAQANGLVDMANRASFEELDEWVGLNARAATRIVEARPIPTIEHLGEVKYVGASALSKMLDYLPMWLGVDATPELGIISDLDKTIIPPTADGLPDAAYPGVAALMTELEFRDSGEAGDMYFVTARTPERVVDVPDWLAAHGVPVGPIDTGVSGVPWVAQREKVADITAIFTANPDQRFVLIGDTSHVDPEVQRQLLSSMPQHVAGAYVHLVTDADSDRLLGLSVYRNYAELAALMVRDGHLDTAAARRVMRAAQSEGLDISDEEIDALAP
jgi:DNA uptake protein ComE-like DNA-binding protein